MITNKKLILFTVFLVAGLLVIGGCNTPEEEAVEEFPTKSIDIIIPHGTGSLDTETRTIAKYVEQILGQPLVIENMPGAGSAVGTEYFWDTPQDGYTILATVIPHHVFAEFLHNPKYNTDDIPVILGWASDPKVIIAPPDSPFQTFEDVIKASEQKPVTVATTGYGSSGHLQVTMLEKVTGLKVDVVPYEGGGDVDVAVMGGHVDIGVTGLNSAYSKAKDGQYRIIALHDYKRHELIPDVPTILELGYEDMPNALTMVRGLWANRGVSEEKIEIIRDAFKQALENPDLQQWAANSGRKLEYISPEDLLDIQNATKQAIRELYAE